MSSSEVTVGIDIGTSSVKAVAVDADGSVVARSRVPHAFRVPAPLRFEHDAAVAWHDGPLRALDELGDIRPRGVSVAAMVPSLAAVDARGMPIGPGLLYGDDRGQAEGGKVGGRGELAGFLEWQAAQYPDASGFWMAQAVANHALTGHALVSTTVAATADPLFNGRRWDDAVLAESGVDAGRLPEIAVSGRGVAEVRGRDGCVLEAGTIDAFAEQIVAGADDVGDVLVLLGTTLIVWAVVPDPVEQLEFFCVPHTAPGGVWLFGGPSNVGGLFLEWSRRLGGAAAASDEPTRLVEPHDVPIWVPYPRGERVPLHDTTRRASLHDLDLTHGPRAMQRAAFEASGFVTRRMIDASPVDARRIVATGGGTRVDGWVEALADATGLPVHVAAIPEGGARGAAFLARVAAGLESNVADAARWAGTDRVVDPDPRWQSPTADRYERFRMIAG